ncbi:MAG: protein kinase [Ruminococcaceae bacterium]|nr:protein kinase [Oscillospiraceae bacterium]
MRKEKIASNSFHFQKDLRDGFIAKNQQDGRLFVLKPADSFVDPEVVNWLARNRYPGVPRCYGSTTGPNGRLCHIFEYLSGSSLDQLIGEGHGRLGLNDLLSLMLQWARILSFLHLRNDPALLHLDIKPANLIVGHSGCAGLIDFTAACLHDRTMRNHAVQQKKALTLNYAAPERTRGHPVPASDFYALGLSVLVALTGLNPADCRGKPIKTILGEAPTAVQTLFVRCLHADPVQRFEHADAMVYALRQLLDQDLQQASCRPVSDSGRSVRKRKRLPAMKFRKSAPLPAASIQPEAKTSALPASLICVWDGAACGCELAAVLAEQQDVLVIDADLLNPRADLLLGNRAPFNRDRSFNEASGLELALQAEQQGRLNPKLLRACTRETAIPRVRLVEGVHQLDKYEYCHLDSLHQTLKWARLGCDVVIVLCSRSVFDAYTCLCVMAADQVIIPLRGQAGDFREMTRAALFLGERYKISLSRFSFVAYPYDARHDLSRGTLNELCDNRLLGCISDQSARRNCTDHAKPYASRMIERNRREYRRLLRALRLLPDPAKEN